MLGVSVDSVVVDAASSAVAAAIAVFVVGGGVEAISLLVSSDLLGKFRKTTSPAPRMGSLDVPAGSVVAAAVAESVDGSVTALDDSSVTATGVVASMPVIDTSVIAGVSRAVDATVVVDVVGVVTGGATVVGDEISSGSFSVDVAGILVAEGTGDGGGGGGSKLRESTLHLHVA